VAVRIAAPALRALLSVTRRQPTDLSISPSVGFAQKVFYVRKISRTKAQRRKEKPAQRGSALRPCAFAREELSLPELRG
jgi:hypothetical protein